MKTLPDTAQHLNAEESQEVFGAILDGQASEDEIARYLRDLSARSETAEEITGAARALRQRLIPIEAPPDAIDVCGTGGDGQHTLNVSTTVSLVVAACGVPVAKHGNRAASSKSGAADTLEALGLDMEAAGLTAEKTLAEIGICFLFAKNHHPAMGRIQPIRKKLGTRTIFNLMGPLSNPAQVHSQLIGIARPAYVPIYAQAKANLGTKRSLIVSGDEGLDELSLAGGNEVADIRGDSFEMQRVDASVCGLPPSSVEAIRGGDAKFNAAALRDVLQGIPGSQTPRETPKSQESQDPKPSQSAYRDAVIFNAAAALIVAEKVSEWSAAAAMAAEAIDSRKALGVLDRWITMVQ